MDILELLHKAKVDLKPLLSSLNANKARLKESCELCLLSILRLLNYSFSDHSNFFFFFFCFVVANSGVVLSLEEVEVGLKGLNVRSEQPPPPPRPSQSRGGGTPFMAEHLEQALTGAARVMPRPRDGDMSAFNKLVSSMKASGTLPTHPKASGNSVSVLVCMILYVRAIYMQLSIRKR